MRRSVVFVIVGMLLVMGLAAPVVAKPPDGKGKPPPKLVEISLEFQYSGPDAPQPTTSCVFAELFSWNANVKGTFEYTVSDAEGNVVASESVTFRRPGSSTFFEFSLDPAVPGDTFDLLHTASLKNHKGKEIATFGEVRTLTCNEWNENP